LNSRHSVLFFIHYTFIFHNQGHPLKEKPICSENLQKERRGGKIPDTSATDHG